MTGRNFLYGIAIPGVLALGVLAAIAMPNGDHLGWPRLIAGLAAYLAINVGGSMIGARYAARS